MTNAQKLARDCALDVLKAYNEKIRTPVRWVASEREAAQSAAFAAAEKHVRGVVIEHVTDMAFKDSWTKDCKGFNPVGDARIWLDEKAKEET